MVDPISLIVMALVSGALAGIQSAAQDSVTTAYGELKAVLLRKYSSRDHAGLATAIAGVEREPRSPTAVATLRGQLQLTGAEHDPEVYELANLLVTIIDDPMTHLAATGPLEAAQRQAGARAVGRVLDRHMGTVMQARSDHETEDTGLLTTNMSSSDLPKAVRDEILSLHGDIRDIIERISAQIEDGNYREAESAIQTMPMGKADRQRAIRLINADKQVHVSYQTLRVTVELFGELNQNVLAKIERETSPDRESNMMLGNAILIYELTEYVIRHIEGFTVVGNDDVETLNRENQTRLAALRQQQKELEEQASEEGIEPSARTHILEDIRNRDGAIDELEREWASYVSEIRKLHMTVGEIRAKVKTLELIRNNARLQIGVLQAVAMLRFLKQNSDAIQGTIEALKGFRLAPLSPNRVRRLLGIR